VKPYKDGYPISINAESFLYPHQKPHLHQVNLEKGLLFSGETMFYCLCEV